MTTGFNISSQVVFYGSIRGTAFDTEPPKEVVVVVSEIAGITHSFFNNKHGINFYLKGGECISMDYTTDDDYERLVGMIGR